MVYALKVTKDLNFFFQISPSFCHLYLHSNLNEILNISANIESANKADHISEIPGIVKIIVSKIMYETVKVDE